MNGGKGSTLTLSIAVFMSANMYPAMRHLMDHHAEPEVTGEPESEPKTIMPEIMTNQETFLMYGIFIFVLAVLCVVLLILFCQVKKQVRRLNDKMGYGQGSFQMGPAESKGYIA